MTTNAIQAFCDRKFGMFIHWGLYALPGGRHNGKVMEPIGEWFQSYFRMPNEEYAKFAAKFNPVKFNADEWIRKAAEAGIRYIVFTTKHHDGFCMYDTKVSDYNIVKMTPFGRDPLRELQHACEKYGVKLGVYYSHHLDWHEKDGGDPDPSRGYNCNNMHWGNDWDFPNRAEKNFARYFHGKVIPQVTELLTNYGEICELWCDCPMDIKPEFSQELRALVKKLQPNCMINSRIGNNCHDFVGLGDNQLLCNRLEYPVESPGTLNNTWGFKYDDHNWKSTEQIITQLVSLVEKNANYLLNIGPTPEGDFTPETDHILSGLADWIREKKHAIYASSPNPFPLELDFAFCTQKGNQLNLFFKKALKELTLNGIRGHLLSAGNATFVQNGETITLQLPDFQGEFLPLLTLEFAEPPQIRKEFIPQNGAMILGMSAGEIREGKNDVTTNQEIIDEAAVAHKVAAHAHLDRDGSICDWNNTVDSVAWNVEFPEAGSYEISLITQTRWAQQPWDGGRLMEVEWNTRRLASTLEKDRDFSTFHRKQYESRLGVLTVRAGERGTLILRTLRIDSKAAGELNISALRVVRK